MQMLVSATDTSRPTNCPMLALLRCEAAGYGLVPHHHAEEHASLTEYPICSLRPFGTHSDFWRQINDIDDLRRRSSFEVALG
jgi:hypothetical protein